MESSRQCRVSAVAIARWIVLGSLCLAGGCGCGGKGTPVQQITKNIQQVQEQVTKTVTDTTQKAAGLATGSVELSLNGPLKIDRCFARFTPPTGGRRGVLQLMSYERLNPQPREEEFPSVFLWADVPNLTAAELAGKTIPGHLFVQREPAGQLYATPPTQPVEIKIAHVDTWSLTCELAGADVPQIDGERPATVSGKLVGLWSK